MKTKQPEFFEISNTPVTVGRDTGYSSDGTANAMNYLATFAQKSELASMKEIFNIQFDGLKDSVKDLRESINGRETRFWIAVGIIITILLFVTPLIYFKIVDNKVDASIRTVNTRCEIVDKKIQEVDLAIKRISVPQ